MDEVSRQEICHQVMIIPKILQSAQKKDGEYVMVRWYYKSIFDELDEMRNYMEALYHQMYETSPTALLPSGRESAMKMLPAHHTRPGVDVSVHGDEVIVTADLIPGVTKKDITLDLINPQALEISWERKEERKEDKEGYYLRERLFGTMTRIIPLPIPVTDDKATATVKNGVLEVHLRKTAKNVRGNIPID